MPLETPAMRVSHSPQATETTVRGAAALSGGRWLERIAVRSIGRIAIVPVVAIVRIEAEDNYVRLYADRTFLHKEPLTRLLGKLDPECFLRVHRSHAVNLAFVRELHQLLHGEYRVVLADGAAITSGRSYTDDVRAAFGLS
jgi:two-component system LytT family response regulator